MSGSIKVVVVDDEFLIAAMNAFACEDLGFTVAAVCHNAQDAIDAILKHKPTHVLLDVRLNDTRDGVDVATAIKAHGAAPEIIYITGSTEPSTTERMLETGPKAILNKPIDASDIEKAVLQNRVETPLAISTPPPDGPSLSH